MIEGAWALDAEERYSELDPENMYRRVEDLPAQIEGAWQLANNFALPDEYRSVRNILISGMGGSAIGGSLLEAYGEGRIPIPFVVRRGYGVPAWVNADTLVICISYSGNTEETVSALEAAHQRDAKLLTITTGGKIGELSDSWRIPSLRFSYSAQPRAALGYLFTPLLNIMARLGCLSDQGGAVAESLELLRSHHKDWARRRSARDNLAKQLALQMHSRILVFYGSEFMAPVARRWKTQMNENAKNWAFFEEFSELNHNSVVGFELSEDQQLPITVTVLQSRDASERSMKRIRVTDELMDRYDVRHLTVDAQGESHLAQMLYLVGLGDYVSYYLAILNAVNPTSIETIDYLKAALSRGS